MADVRTPKDITLCRVYTRPNWKCLIVAKFFLSEHSDKMFEPNNLLAIHSTIL